jgi:alanine racemase
MYRPTRISIDSHALVHNVQAIKHRASGKKIIAMVKANAYGCGLSEVIPTLDGLVDAFGVTSLDEAMSIRKLGSQTECVLFQGFFKGTELGIIAAQRISVVLYTQEMLKNLLSTRLERPLSVWIKVNTGMNRLGFSTQEVSSVLSALEQCPWVSDIGVMTHLACADEPWREENKRQLELFEGLNLPNTIKRSVTNSAGILAFPDVVQDVVRPGIMLYGISPFSDKTGVELGLKPVVRLTSELISVYPVTAMAHVGYAATWQANKDTVIGIVAIGYGDGYPRHIAPNTPVWTHGQECPIVGRVSMDMIAVDVTSLDAARIGDVVELWGAHLPIERIAKASGTIAYELLCQLTGRVRYG